MVANFEFLRLAERPHLANALVGVLPAKIRDSDVLLRAVADALSFPAYFGQNWNALFDCLRDFHWTEARHIFLIHEDLPSIPGDELKVYLCILRDAVADWKAHEGHQLHVVFDVSSRGAVARAMESTFGNRACDT